MTEPVINEPAKASEFIIPAEEAAKAEQAAEAAKAEEAAAEAAKNEPGDKVEEGEPSKADRAAAREAYRARKAQREAEELRTRLATLEAEKTKPAAEEKGLEAPKRPNPNDFELGRWDEKYEEALSKWADDHAEYTVKRAAETAREATKSLSEEAKATTENATLLARVDEVGAKGVDKYDDFEEIVQDAFEAMPPSPDAMKELVGMENAEDVLYHIAQRPETLEKITAMTPMGQALEFGKISARLAASAKASERTTKAKPTPTQPRGESGQYSSEDEARYAKMLKATNRW